VGVCRQLGAHDSGRARDCRQLGAHPPGRVVVCRQLGAHDSGGVGVCRQQGARPLGTVVVWQTTTNQSSCTGCDNSQFFCLCLIFCVKRCFFRLPAKTECRKNTPRNLKSQHPCYTPIFCSDFFVSSRVWVWDDFPIFSG
ncbi:unnamed protein product, partial [Ectocarpus sp. 12 AP-2014]